MLEEEYGSRQPLIRSYIDELCNLPSCSRTYESCDSILKRIRNCVSCLERHNIDVNDQSLVLVPKILDVFSDDLRLRSVEHFPNKCTQDSSLDWKVNDIVDFLASEVVILSLSRSNCIR